MNNEDFVTYETAVKLKELGFDWECAAFYHSGFSPEDNVAFFENNSIDDHNHRGNPRVYSAPTMAKAQKWLREVKGIAINVTAHDGGKYQWEDIYLPNAAVYKGYIRHDIKQYTTYESALAAGIEAALKLIEEGES